jgi:hypothetical protein
MIDTLDPMDEFLAETAPASAAAPFRRTRSATAIETGPRQELYPDSR